MATKLADIEDIYAIPLDQFNVAQPELWEAGAIEPYFDRLRKEDPVHYCADSQYGPYWSITKFNDIMFVDSHHDLFSSEPSIAIGEPELDFEPPMFIAMDQPKHDDKRKSVTPAVAPGRLAETEELVRERVCKVLDSLPIGEEFNWVDKVSIELTTQMLATLFDFPFEDRRKLTFWSDMATASPDQVGAVDITEEERKTALMECLEVFTGLWKERENKPQDGELDFVSALANSEATKDISPDASPLEYLGTLILLIVGGNDTTRNSTSGGVLALNENPQEYEKLRNDPSLIPNMVNEIIRWQTPLSYMRRTATRDCELGGKPIRKHDQLLMWYLSGNRDKDVFENADALDLERSNAGRHLSFGHGTHFCMGSRLAEMQLRIVWEEVLARFREVEVVGEPVRVRSNFVKGLRPASGPRRSLGAAGP